MSRFHFENKYKNKKHKNVKNLVYFIQISNNDNSLFDLI